MRSIRDIDLELRRTGGDLGEGGRDWELARVGEAGVGLGGGGGNNIKRPFRCIGTICSKNKDCKHKANVHTTKTLSESPSTFL